MARTFTRSRLRDPLPRFPISYRGPRGSDVGANAVSATPLEDGTWQLNGEKWFCSVIDAQLFLVTARPVGAPFGTSHLRAFAVPRNLADGRVNDFHIRRLKYKLGTRSMASAEVDFCGAIAHPVGVLSRRCHHRLEYVAPVQRHLFDRSHPALVARSQRLCDTPTRIRRAHSTVPDGATAARATQCRGIRCAREHVFLAQLTDTPHLSERQHGAWRILVNLNKFWTSVTATSCIRTAIEILGGNGAIEEFSVLPRLLRDSIVCEAWEGSHNVLCAQALKDGNGAVYTASCSSSWRSLVENVHDFPVAESAGTS